MKTKRNYKYRLTNAFYNYANVNAKNKINREELVKILKDIEQEEKKLHSRPKDKNLWIRFGDGAIIYTIQDIERDLDLQKTTLSNYDFLVSQMTIATFSDPDYLKINFS